MEDAWVHAGAARAVGSYEWIAPLYDALMWIPERGLGRWRRDLWRRVRGPRVLEVGVGTGLSLSLHPPGAEVAAIDVSPAMLARAGARAARLGRRVDLRVADVQRLPFPDATFDEVVGTLVFCAVPDQRRGLREVRRVLRPGGRLLLVEHVLSERPLLRTLMREVAPIPRRICCESFDRETTAAVRAAGFEVVQEEHLLLDVVRRIVARAPA